MWRSIFLGESVPFLHILCIESHPILAGPVRFCGGTLVFDQPYGCVLVVRRSLVNDRQSLLALPTPHKPDALIPVTVQHPSSSAQSYLRVAWDGQPNTINQTASGAF